MIKNVILDYGHGGIDSNGKYTTFPAKMHTFDDGVVAYEGVLNREIGNQIKNCVQAFAPELNIVETVPYNDPTDVSLSKRVELTNKFPPESTIFVSIHCNASNNHNASGFEIFSSLGETGSDELAENISDMVSFALNNQDIKDRGVKEANFYVLRETKCIAVLIECGFFDFREEFDKLKDPIVQGDLASFIATGIVNYIDGKNKQQE